MILYTTQYELDSEATMKITGLFKFLHPVKKAMLYGQQAFTASWLRSINKLWKTFCAYSWI